MATKKSRQQEIHAASEDVAPVGAGDVGAFDPEPGSEYTSADTGVDAPDGDKVLVEDMATVKARWLDRQQEIETAERHVGKLKAQQQSDTDRIAETVIDAAKARGGEAVFMFGARRMKAKRRPAKHGGGYMLIDASIPEALDI